MSELSYRVIRSKRKTIALQINPDGTVVVRCPLKWNEGAVHAFVESKRSWIEKHLNHPRLPAFTDAQIQALTHQAREVLTERVAFYAPLVGVEYGNITIRHQRTRWGSCSGKGNLNFNCLLMEVPTEVRDYVVVHELCHRKEMNHSKKFWAEVARVMPDYKVHCKWLKDHGAALIGRMRNEEEK